MKGNSRKDTYAVLLPDGNGLDLVQEIRRFNPETKVIVLTSYTDENTLMKAIDLGVNGFISKNAPPQGAHGHDPAGCGW